MEPNASYFKASETSVDTSHLDVGPFYKSVDAVRGFSTAPGLTLKPISGKGVMMSFVYFEPNTLAPVHSHVEEQMGTVMEGEMEFELNGVRQVMRRGDVYYAPSGVPHAARTYGEPCMALDVFAPPRAAFQELMRHEEEHEHHG